MQGSIFPKPKKGVFGITKNYWGITITSIVDNVHNVLLLNRIEPEIEKIFREKEK